MIRALRDHREHPTTEPSEVNRVQYRAGKDEVHADERFLNRWESFDCGG
jgi:hypothetical protein